MKNLKKWIAVFVVLAAATSCKKGGTEGEAAKGSEEPAVQVVVDMVVKKDDMFQMFYTEDGSIDFGPKSVLTKVTGKNESQLIVFNMPEDAKITNLRFDIGDNKQQEEMIINKLIVKQNDKEMELSAADFFTHFNVTDGVKANPEKFSLKGVELNGQYDPFLYGNASLINALKALTQPAAN